jgi:hypothetical protein
LITLVPLSESGHGKPRADATAGAIQCINTCHSMSYRFLRGRDSLDAGATGHERRGGPPRQALMPSFAMRLRRVLGGTPRIAAAPP